MNYYILKKLNNQSFPSRIIYIDTETKQQKKGDVTEHTYKLGWLCYAEYDKTGQCEHEEWRFCRTKEEMAKYIDNKNYEKSKLLIVAHNIYFDLQVSGFFSYFARKKYKVKFLYNKGLTFLLKIAAKKRSIMCLSTTNFYAESLESLGETLGTEKTKVDFGNVSEEQLAKYCRNDVFVIKTALEKWFEFLAMYQLGKFGYTRASQALIAYRTKYMTEKITICDDQKIKQFERLGYYGGRCEAFFLGKLPEKKYVSLDINSMYPYVMRENLFPIKYVGRHINPTNVSVEDFLRKFGAIAHVVVETTEPIYPMKKDGKLVYPIGTFETYLCTEALSYSLKNKQCKKIIEIQWYQMGSIFSEYINKLYDMRSSFKKDGNKIYEKNVKLLMNSLYGKFGQKKVDQEIEEIDDVDNTSRVLNIDLVSGKSYMETILMGTRIADVGESESQQSFPAIAAHVTDYARMYLYRIMKEIGLENVLYVDTDSIKCEVQHLQKIVNYINDQELGKLKIEYTFEIGEIRGLKAYTCGDHTTEKGIPKKAVKIDDHTYQYDSFLKFPEHLKKNVHDTYLVRKTIKKLNYKYTKGIVLVSGKIKPLNLVLRE